MTDAPTGRLLRRGLAVLRREVALHPRPFAIGVSGAAAFAGLTVTQSYVFGRIVDRVVIPRFETGHVPAGSVMLAVCAIVGVGVLKAIAIVTRRVGAGIAQFSVRGTLSERVTEQYQRLPLQWHRANPAGELIAHAGQDVEAATEVLAPLPFATGVVVLVFLSAAWLVATDLVLALVGLVVLPSVFLVNVLYQRRVEAPATRAQAQVGEVSTVAHESFDGALVVKTLGADDHESARFRVHADALRDSRIEVARLRATFESVLDALPALGMVVLLLVGSWRIETGAITAGTLVAFVSLFTLLTWPLRLIAFVLEELPRAVAGHDRVGSVLGVSPSSPHGDGPGRPLPDGALAVDVDHVTFSFEDGATVLHDVSVHVAPGSTLALVGPTGSGKSTLALLLAGLLRPDSGVVRIGGIDISEADPQQLAETAALAFQEPFLFGTTVAENILLGLPPGEEGTPAARAAMAEAADLARADGFIRALPDGYEAVLGERGATLSGGQRQRVALARALVRRPRLLVLDDATSSVDPTTEAAIVSGLEDRLGVTTTVVVASRPATIALADQVAFMAEGRIVAVGPHNQLLADVPGYARLVRAYEEDQVAS